MTCATGEGCGDRHAAGKCPWVRVESISELTPGVAVKTIGCGTCGKNCIGVVMSVPYESEVVHWTAPDDVELEVGVDVTACSGLARGCTEMCIVESDLDGRVLRLAGLPPDESTADDVQTARPATTKRTLERTRR